MLDSKVRPKRVAALGAGVIGAGWIAAFLGRGYEVAVYDPNQEIRQRVPEHVIHAWPEMVRLGLCSGAPHLGLLKFSNTLEEALAGADFVQESTIESLELKTQLFQQIDALVTAEVVVASSTSSLPITQLQSQCRFPERFVLGHPYNPVHLMPLVETGGGDKTSFESIERVEAIYRSMGKRTIRVRKEIYGHIANRLTSALFREAVSLVDGGYATVEEIDDAVRFGPAMKWAIQGPFTTFHTTGGVGGFENFLHHFSPGIVKRWETMTSPDLMAPDLRAELVAQVESASKGRPVSEIANRQDALLTRILQILHEERSTDRRRT